MRKTGTDPTFSASLRFHEHNKGMRKARVIVDGATYHVIARTNRKEMLLDSAFSKDLFLQVLLQAKSHYYFEIDNFMIMGNHFHLLLRPTNGSTLSEIMKWIMGMYTMNDNRIYNNWGHFWGSRYFSRPITSFTEYLKALPLGIIIP